MNKENKYFFFIRSTSDFNFLLPLIVNLSNSEIIFYQKQPENSNALELLSYFDIKYINISNKKIAFIERIFNFLSRFGIKVFDNYLYYEASNLKKFIKSNSKYFDDAIIIFDHTDSISSKKLINILRLHQVKSIISLPHGTNHFLNKLTNVIDTSHKKMNLSHFDKVICNSEKDKCLFEGDIEVINNLRNHKEWIDVLLTFHKKKYIKKIVNNGKCNVLIICSQSVGNINIREYGRVIKILHDSNKFDVTVAAHPRDKEDRRYLVKYKNLFTFANRDLFQEIIQSDLVINFQSSAVNDAIFLKKMVVNMDYATSNLMQSDFLNRCIRMESPDNFLSFVESFNISKISNLSYNPPNINKSFNSILEDWKFFFNELNK